jgi:AraC-like DNA-binding protein
MRKKIHNFGSGGYFMKPKIDSFLEEIPKIIRINAREYIGRNIAVFQPGGYVTDQRLYCDHYQFLLFFSRPPILKIGSSEYQFKKGSLVALKPGMELIVPSFEGNVAGDFISVTASTKFLDRIAQDLADREDVCLKRLESFYSSCLVDVLNNFIYEQSNYAGKYPRMLECIETQVAIQLLREMSTDFGGKKRKKNMDFKYINRALEYLHDNYNGIVTLEDVSREAFISPSHFERVFKNYIGQTPHRYLIELRLQKAKEIMSRDEYTIEEIARMCGFVNAAHFSTTFKRIVGMTPSRFRAKGL